MLLTHHFYYQLQALLTDKKNNFVYFFCKKGLVVLKSFITFAPANKR